MILGKAEWWLSVCSTGQAVITESLRQSVPIHRLTARADCSAVRQLKCRGAAQVVLVFDAMGGMSRTTVRSTKAGEIDVVYCAVEEADSWIMQEVRLMYFTDCVMCRCRSECCKCNLQGSIKPQSVRSQRTDCASCAGQPGCSLHYRACLRHMNYWCMIA